MKDIRYLHDMRILIVGGGIAGLTLAGLLEKRGAKAVTVIEKAGHYGQVGYVLGIWPAGSRILKGLDLYPDFLESGVVSHSYEIADAHGQVLHHYDFAQLTQKYGPCVCLERSQLIQVLLKGLTAKPEMGVSIEHMEEKDAEVIVRFSNGTERTFDLVVGCDGLRSQVRKYVCDQPLSFMGATGWGFWIHPDELPGNRISEYWGAGQFFGIYPAKDKLCVFAAINSKQGIEDPESERINRIEQAFGNMGGLVPGILSKLTDPSQIFHDDFHDIKINRWHRGRVLLIGDAAHGVLPSAGIGASLAMESAAVLADELSRTDSNDVPQCLNRYIKRRRKRVDSLQDQSRIFWKMMFVSNATLSSLRDLLMRFYSEEEMMKTMEALLADPI